MTEERLIRADKSYRRRVILLYGVLVCLGLAGALYVPRVLEEFSR